MPQWILARETEDLTADGAWHGLDMAATSAPDPALFFPVGRGIKQGALIDDQGYVQVTIGWLNAVRQPVAGAGTSLTVAPAVIRRLPLPRVPTQRMEIIHVGEARENSAWDPLGLYVGPAAFATVHLSTMVFASAAAVAVWYWGNP